MFIIICRQWIYILFRLSLEKYTKVSSLEGTGRILRKSQAGDC